ncbi:unnamed protein product [Lampetra planeri]
MSMKCLRETQPSAEMRNPASRRSARTPRGPNQQERRCLLLLLLLLPLLCWVVGGGGGGEILTELGPAPVARTAL